MTITHRANFTHRGFIGIYCIHLDSVNNKQPITSRLILPTSGIFRPSFKNIFPSDSKLQPNVLKLLRTIAAPVWQMIKDDILEFHVFLERTRPARLFALSLLSRTWRVMCVMQHSALSIYKTVPIHLQLFSYVKELLLHRYVLEGIPGN